MTSFIVFSGTSYAWPLSDGYLTSLEKWTCSCTPFLPILRWTIQSRWRSALRIVFTLSLSTINPSEYSMSGWKSTVLFIHFLFFFYWMQHFSPSLETHTSTVCHFGFHFFMCTQVYNTTLSVQVPPKGCYCGQDIFFVGPHQDQAHGNRYHQERNNWLR